MKKTALTKFISRSRRRRSFSAGLSLIEIIISVAILAILTTIALIFFQLQIARSRDARRKADLERIKVAFEEYYNDYNCYPDPGILNNCNGTDLQPYLAAIPCDPWTGEPYLYVPDQNNQCRAYRVLTQLEDPTDPAIARLNCDGPEQCNYGDGYNYGVSSGQPVKGDGTYIPPSPNPTPSPAVSPSPTPSVSPSPSPSGTPDFYYACDGEGACNIYHDPEAAGCPITFQDPNCANACGNLANRCVK